MKKVLILFLLLVNCGDKADPLSLVKRFRVPMVQFYAESQTNIDNRGCVSANDAAPFYCQQFPLVEPAASTTQTYYILLQTYIL